MGRPKTDTDWLAARVLKAGAALGAEFQSDYLDFDRGIRVGHLEPRARITQLFKRRLAERHGVPVVCDRWGRGVYWQWICWVPEPNRRAKPLSSAENFASAKFFVSIDREARVFQSGFQVERAPVKPASGDWPIRLADDWDWHVLLRALRGRELPRLVSRLLREGFRVRVGPFEELHEYDRRSWSAAACRRRALAMPPRQWGGFQLFWPMREREVKDTPGPEILDAVAAVFDAVVPAMRLCMYAPCLREG